MKVVALAGGTGSAKLLRGLYGIQADLTVVANVGDNAWTYGAYVCPDVDIACYTLAGIDSRAHGWGIEGDTFAAMGELERLGVETWFRLGDRDLAVCLARTEMLRRGLSLTEATDWVRRGLGVRSPVLPACDQPVETRLTTRKGELNLQEFWVRERGRPGVTGVTYSGARHAKPSMGVREAIMGADRVVVCPANPVTSIGPMLAIPGFARLLRETEVRVVAVSPMAGNRPISGPAGKLMKAVGERPDSLGVARMYSGFLDALLIAREDAKLAPAVRSMGVSCTASDTLMNNSNAEVRLAKELLEL